MLTGGSYLLWQEFKVSRFGGEIAIYPDKSSCCISVAGPPYGTDFKIVRLKELTLLLTHFH